MGTPVFARRLLVTTLLGIIVLSVTLGLLFGPRWVAALAGVWAVALIAAWSHYRYRSKLGTWERAQSEAWNRQEQASRERSSAELHEELERQVYVALEGQRARPRKRDGRA
jgi:membrane protein implicated in regulation of membrane protease activity